MAAGSQKPTMEEWQSIFKRGSTSVEPHHVTLITDRNDPMYDARVHLDVPDVDVLNLASAGYIQPISLRLRTKDVVAVDGVQRVKRGLVLNHLVGKHKYTGTLAPVLDAIKRLSDAENLIARRIIELAPDGVKIPITVHRGKESEAFLGKVSANAFRRGDQVIECARKAQQLDRHGHTESDIAEALNVSVATVKRWLVMDTEKERAPRKKRSKSVRPTPRRVQEAFDMVGDGWSEKEKAIFEWVLGKRTREELEQVFPKLRKASEQAEDQAA